MDGLTAQWMDPAVASRAHAGETQSGDAWWVEEVRDGARVIVTGLSPEIAQTLVNIGVDLGKMNTVGDLQGGIEEAERVLGYKVVLVQDHKPL